MVHLLDIDVDKMGLRDYFAAKAMQALIQNQEPNIHTVVRVSFQIADLMLEERDND
jgi:hypothetical protein